VDYEGRPNPNGVPAQMNIIAPSDAPVVRNLKKAGAIVIGLTNTPEFSFRGFTDNPLHGLTLNPWDPDITCGGSSGGAGAAVAAGIGTIAHGNDIGGSLRWPAHCNGITTIKPTQGRIPAYNQSAAAERPMLAHLMSAQGPLARSVADLRLALEVMSQRDPRDPWWVPAPLSHRPVRAASASSRNAANAENIACRKTRSPAAQVKVRYLVGRTESVHQSAHEAGRIHNGRRRWGRLAEGDPFRSMLFRNAAHGGCGLIERRIP
jgi:Asp-tRNA(Asn)/Glu-tRNA(Gln) amidotransferase A subunit family amidase